MSIIITLLVILFIFWCIAGIFLTGPDLSRYDSPTPEAFKSHSDDEQKTQVFLNEVSDLRKELFKQAKPIKGFKEVRNFADNLSADLQTDTVFQSSIANNVDIEWAIAKGVDTKRRIVFMHGGAFIFGSAKGHRKFCDRLSKIANAAVCSVNYRMLPEHGRLKGIKDCQEAYRWVLNNGPNGPEELDFLLVSGDSAGGNLALMLSGWSKDSGIRQADGIIAFSPSTDMTLSSKTIKEHRDSDKLLGESLGLASKVPTSIAAWLGLIALRINPANRLASPLFGNLSNLPPTLIHCSSNEVLFGEAVRYANKAKAAGSPVTIQSWENQPHDWHLFNMGVGSAEAAWSEVKLFIENLPTS